MSNTNSLNALRKSIKNDTTTFQAFCQTVAVDEHPLFSPIDHDGTYHTLWCKPGKGQSYAGFLKDIDGGDGSLTDDEKHFLKRLWSAMNAARTVLEEGGFKSGSFRISIGKKGVSVNLPNGSEAAPVAE